MRRSIINIVTGGLMYRNTTVRDIERIAKPDGTANKVKTIRRHRVAFFFLKTLRSNEIAGMFTRVTDSALQA